jgi:hypothetical protein
MDNPIGSDAWGVPQARPWFSVESIFLFTLRPGWCELCGTALMVHLERPRTRPDLRWRLAIHEDELEYLFGSEEADDLLRTPPHECCWRQLEARWPEVLRAACVYFDVPLSAPEAVRLPEVHPVVEQAGGGGVGRDALDRLLRVGPDLGAPMRLAGGRSGRKRTV